MAGETARMVFTDPPYNVRIDGHVCGLGAVKHAEFAMATGEMSEAEFTSFLQTVLDQMASHSTDGAIHFVCMDWRHLFELLTAGRQVYSELKNLCVWNKSNGGMGSLYRSKHELIAVFKAGRGPHINTVELGAHGRYRTNVWDYAGINSFGKERDAELAMHPTVKPVALVEDAILDCSRRNDIVLDAFVGSGTTIVAAERAGRRAFGLELDPRYVDAALRRFRDLAGNEPVHAASGFTFSELS
jgi:DNA modification methylase